MLFIQEKLSARLQELAELRYREARPIADFRSLEDAEGSIGARPPHHPEAAQTMRIGDRWQGKDRYLWLQTEVEVPRGWEGKRVLGRFDFGSTGGGNNSGFESLLYINGEPYQGVDTNHEEVFLRPDAVGAALQLSFRLWSGLGGYSPLALQEHKLKRAELCWLDADADDLYYSAYACLDVVAVLHEHAAERQMLLSAVDRAFLLIDWARPRSDAFYASVSAAAAKLRESIGQMPKHHPVTVRCIGHTHIDVAWLWRLKHTREKAARSFSTVLRLMESFPDYTFLQTMPQLYEYIKTDYPDIYAQIRERVREGRWEAGGGMWLEADCNLTSGESLVRQLLYGTRFLREEFGVECTYLWLPDVFGYSWALPQILRKSGIETFMTTKISWNQYNRMPHDTFMWRGIDGTELLTHFITTPDSSGGWLYTYNGEVTAKSVSGIWEAYRDKSVNRELLLSYGYGDGGGGVNRDMLELRRRLDELPGVPHVTTGRADDYFNELQRTVKSTDAYVHTWDGELYLELHRGTYTSQAYNKRMNRKLELAAREAEWMGVMGSLQQGDWSAYATHELATAWRIILRNQFHDIIPGSSIQEVYADSRLEYAEAEQLLHRAFLLGEQPRAVGGNVPSMELDRAAEQAAESLAGGTVTVWNSAGWERSGVVFVADATCHQSGNEGLVWRSQAGDLLQAQRGEGGWWVCVKQLPSMGCIALHYEIAQHEALVVREKPFRLLEEGNGLVTPYYKLRWNDSGQLVSIWDIVARREVLAEGEKGNVLQVFEDKPKGRHEAWDIDIFYQEKMEELRGLTSVQMTETGPLRTVVRFTWTYSNSTVQQDLIVYAHSRRIDFVTEVEWHEQRKLLKAAFPVQIRSTEATYDIQFGNVKRPTHWNTSWDYARFEVAGHQWADLSERGYGVSLLNDCKYGYDIKDHTMRLTLIKSAMVPDPQADQGSHVFTYSLLPHQGDWLDGNTVQEAWDLNAPLLSRPGQSAASGHSLFSSSGGHAHIDAVKKAEDDHRLVLRFHEYAGKRGQLELSSDYAVNSWQECDLMERPIGEPVPGEKLSVLLKPYEIKTFLVEMKAISQPG
ncbi:alpha-mannosidase [Paenibacillus rigui]|uniref:Alpha-mannosidase n=1 Tax=Paenibacillus rigui TaxID=554312 RepID=A0A229ULG5_9BACL|nr:alpha-mannosidase [Paenibacillus rigui]OXM84223.1 alpha-mannosidase [Paenibacillus rigui]